VGVAATELGALLDTLSGAPPETLRILLNGMEALARESGHAAVFDGWGQALAADRL
jgi:hypothetical protein